MVTIQGLVRCIKSTKNFWIALLLKRFETRRKVVFRNGCIGDLNFLEYKNVLTALSSGYSLESLGSLSCFSKGRIKIMGPLRWMDVLGDDFFEDCAVDYGNKVVLDIGGFLGETAVHFSARGAKKIIIYEPVVNYHEFIKLNMSLNGVNAELHDEGIGEIDGSVTVRYDQLDSDFGLRNNGANEMRIKIRSVKEVIEESGADIAKLDCEGAETSLLGVPSEVLRRIGFYMLETHSPETKKALIDTFERAGFVLIRDMPKASYKGPEKLSTIYFKRI